MANVCNSPHPDRPELRCERDARIGMHEIHECWDDSINARAHWREGSWVEGVTGTRTQHETTMKGIASRATPVTHAAREPRREERRPRRSSVGSNDPHGRQEGATRAGEAMEDDFVEAAIEGGKILSRSLQRWNVDDYWEWLDTHGHFTDHPKGMKSLLDKLIKQEVIRPVPRSDPDWQRPPRRSNSSRQLQTYESLIYVEPPTVLALTPEKLADFG